MSYCWCIANCKLRISGSCARWLEQIDCQSPGKDCTGPWSRTKDGLKLQSWNPMMF